MQLDVNLPELVNVDGMLVEKDVYNIAKKLEEYDPNLKIFFIDPTHRDTNISDAPFLVAELCPDGYYRRIFEAWILDDKILERVYAADTQRHDILLTIEQNNARLAQDNRKRYHERMGEAHDIAAHLLRSPKTTYSIPGVDGNTVTIDSHLGVVKRDNE